MTQRRRPEMRVPAERSPVAEICVDVPLSHLDRPFDYVVPAALDEAVAVGSRVRVRFAGQLVDGYVLGRRDESEHTGRLSFIERSISPEPVLTPEIARLARTVADRWAGSMIDVLRLAIPPRHGRAESEDKPIDRPADPPPPDPVPWARYTAGPAFLREVGRGRAAHAVWSMLSGEPWPTRLAEAAQASLAAGRGSIIVVPDHRDLARVDDALRAVLGAGRHVALAAQLGPAERYRRWLPIVRGQVRVVVGTRAAAFAPVADLGLLVIVDDGDDLHAEPRAPYPHARDVLVLRAHQASASLLIAGHARTAEAQQLIESGWAAEISAPRETVRRTVPRIAASGDDLEQARDPAARAARLPSLAWRTAREALASGAPVLVQVPRRGYAPALACARCHAPARCPACRGPLAARSANASPTCRWCGTAAVRWRCDECHHDRLRAAVVGAGRTAEELGRAFPDVPVRRSGGDTVLDRVPDEAAVVVATPGAEPVADAGYGAALLLDGWALLTRPDLRAAEETLRRWANAAVLVRSGPDGGKVVVMADAGSPVVQALIRWDPAWHASRELAERTELGFPPATRIASLTGTSAAIRDLVAAARLPESAQELGPVPVSDEVERLLLRVPRSAGAALAKALHAAAGVRSARKAPDSVRVQLDPAELV